MYDQSALRTLDYHRSMLADEERTRRLEQAILETVKPGHVVLDLGCGTGVLSCFACRAGARRVYAIEATPVIALARQVCHANGFTDQVAFINAMSIQAGLPEPADVIVTETIGNLGLDEGILGWVLDARSRFLKPGGTLIPRSIELMVSLVESPDAYRGVGGWEELPYGLIFSAARRLAANNPRWVDIAPEALLGQPAALGRIDLAAIDGDRFSGQATVTAARSGVCHGLGAWFDATLTDSVKLSNAPPLVTPSWHQALLPLEQPLEVHAGDVLEVELRAEANGAFWQWSVQPRVADSNHRSQQRRTSQSTFAGQFLSMAEMRRGADGYIPQLTDEGKVRRYILGCMDGSRSVEDIAARVENEFPGLFPHPRYAYDLVRKLSKAYG